MYQVFSLIFGVPLAAFWGLIFGMCFYPYPPTQEVLLNLRAKSLPILEFELVSKITDILVQY